MNTEHALDDNLIGYLLDGLDEETRAEVEAQLQSSPEARRRLNQLRLALEPLAADKDEVAPPAGLAVRTIARVAEYCCRELPHAPMPPPAAAVTRSWWRRADVLIAASLLLTALGIGIPAVLHVRGTHAITQCQNNLRQYHTALQAYHDRHGKFPDIAAHQPHDAAGLVVPILVSAGVWPENISVRCPGNGPATQCPMTLDQVTALSPQEFLHKAADLAPCYAYSLGYLDDAGAYHGLTRADSHVALMADCPPPGAGPGNSRNHGGTGQNILFSDGSVRFQTVRTIGSGDDIYLNRANKVAAGLDSLDTVLGHSGASPRPRP
jgi:hypothetical protein